MKKISELLREGAKGRKQATHAYTMPDGSCCALGAIALAACPEASIIEDDNCYLRLKSGAVTGIGGILHGVDIRLASANGMLYTEIVNMNDNSKMTFEQIARVLEAKGL
jgi:hypothetical protein